MAPSLILRTVVLYYLADRESGRVGWKVPRFVRLRPAAAAAELGVDLDDPTWERLAAEAARQGLPAATLAEHALLYFLADLDGGRLAERVGGAVDARTNRSG
jgi:hypothetical protein